MLVKKIDRITDLYAEEELIAANRYLSEAEFDSILEYEKETLAGEIYSFYSNQPETVVRPYPYEAHYNTAVKEISSQLAEPLRIEEILASMAEVLDHTADFDKSYEFMQKAYQNLKAYQNGKYSLFTSLPAEKETPTMHLPYDIKIGTAVQIGADSYEIQFLSDETVVLQDMTYPLFTREFSREEFEEKLRENPANDHLKSKEAVPELPAEEGTTESREKVTESDEKISDIRKSRLKDAGKVSVTGGREDGKEEGSRIADKKEQETETEDIRHKKPDKARGKLTAAQRNYKTIMELAPEVLNLEQESKSFEAGSSFMSFTIEQIGENRIAISHYFTENGDSFADPDMEFVVDHEAETLNARTYQQDKLNRFDRVVVDGIVNKVLEKELNLFAGQWFKNIREQGYRPVKEEHELTPEEQAAQSAGDLSLEPDDRPEKEGGQKTQENLTPSWKIPKISTGIRPFDLHPEVPHAEWNQYQITNDQLGYGSRKEKFRANIQAIQLLKKCEAENRYATPDEQEILAGYVGWGGLADAFDGTKEEWSTEYLELGVVLTEEEYRSARESTLTAFYTPPVVIRAMYQALENMGLKSGSILEPSCGTGNFAGMKPESLSDCRIYGVEIDSISGRIAQQLYQKSAIAVQGFEEVNLPDSFFDAVIGNIPFGNYKVLDRKYDGLNFLIHDYFVAKSIDKVRPGGVMAFITSCGIGGGTMDKMDNRVRKYIAGKCDLLGAVRLPNNVFLHNAGTDVNADILFFQKREIPRDLSVDMPEWVDVKKLYENEFVNTQGETRRRMYASILIFRNIRKWS